MDTTHSVVNPSEPFLNRREFCELMNVCNEQGADFYERYAFLRFDEGSSPEMLTHEEAMAILAENISTSDCFRLKAAGGAMQEIADLMQTFFDAGKWSVRPIDEYIHFRCARSFSAEKAFVSTCKEYGIDHDKHSAAKEPDKLLNFKNS